MDEDEFEDYDREVELALYREYRDVVSQFRYVVETSAASTSPTRWTWCGRTPSTTSTSSSR
jgi:hypothetical protein